MLLPGCFASICTSLYTCWFLEHLAIALFGRSPECQCRIYCRLYLTLFDTGCGNSPQRMHMACHHQATISDDYNDMHHQGEQWQELTFFDESSPQSQEATHKGMARGYESLGALGGRAQGLREKQQGLPVPISICAMWPLLEERTCYAGAATPGCHSAFLRLVGLWCSTLLLSWVVQLPCSNFRVWDCFEMW